MENIISVMQRYEIKYLLKKEQVEFLVDNLKNYMEVDQYGMTSIASLYYDTPNHRLIRESIDGDNFKEKIRLRSYGLNKPGKPVFLELKRKADGIVYKRRVETSIDDVDKFINYENDNLTDGQISKEIEYFRNYYKSLIPSCLIIYDRVAYFERNGDLRLTIDFNPRFRLDNLNLNTSMDGVSLLNDGEAILEIKVQEAIPLWLSSILDRGKIYKGSFSKYGEAYKKAIINKGDVVNV